MIYLDTSALVPLFVPESDSVKVRLWRDALPLKRKDALAISAWGLTEFASAMGLKVRSRELTKSEADAALALLENVFVPHVTVLEVTPTDFKLAETMLRTFSLGLRAGDALHLAIAKRCAATSIMALDRNLRKAATAFAIASEKI